MELRHLRYFVAVAEELHFGRAAERLHIVQPALSRQIIALERELGVQLLERTKRGVAFTPAGEAFYSEARAIIQRADKAIETTKLTAQGEIGSLDIGFIGPAMWSVLPPILREHRRRLPGMRFHLHELGGVEQLKLLRDGSLDVGFMRRFPPDGVLSFETVLREPMVVGLPEDHPQAAAERVDLADLADETFIIIPRRLSPVSHDLYIAICQSYGISPPVEEGNSPAAFNLVGLGLGVALVPESFQYGSWRGIVFRPLDRETPQAELGIAYRRDERPASLEAFLETVADVVPSVPHGTAIARD